jgi:hypothetical protein
MAELPEVLAQHLAGIGIVVYHQKVSHGSIYTRGRGYLLRMAG